MTLMGAVLTTLVALPILGLVSIPLIISAWITISLALITLLVRFSVVYLEVGYGLVVSFFTIPTSSSSFLPFAASEPVTPAAGNSRRNSAHGLIQSRKNNDDSLLSGAFTAIHDDPTRHKKKSYARSMIEAHHLPNTQFLGLPVSGDERRDFEGVGGWRSYRNPSHISRPRTSHSAHEKTFSSPSSSSAHSINGEVEVENDVDADELAWLSLNYRLELPSQVVTLGAGSNAASAINSPSNVDFDTHNGGSFQALASSTPARFHQTNTQNQHQHRPGQRHHHRSHTTSALTTFERRTGGGLSIALSTRPDQTSRALSPSASRVAPFMTPQPYSPVQTRPSTRMLPVSNGTHSNAYLSSSADGASSGFLASSGGSFGSGSGGYFALQRPGNGNGSHYMPPLSAIDTPSGSGCTTPGTGVSNEDRDASSLGFTRLMAHYPTSVRHRRRSIAGPHSRVGTIGEHTE
ncbi:uncharacterized protein N7496_009769 [Penicillium cataractarum]|uniref:Uncharacterized protein n=1 Tax=Penicillium cataractarum TaxID=2100454 RepID=A0A9W9RQ46_9EURO|nr:uncharacterized protein N7496_009769 [Penicillium cataractarum]KAJ5364056.1 hypothetical protein N7496_009769 [Penicillium cataractarum]